MPMKFSMYVTKDIQASHKMIQGRDKLELEGFPLEYVMEAGPASMTYEVTKISEGLDKSVFEINTSGYTKMTWKEFMDQMGSMGGGMGF